MPNQHKYFTTVLHTSGVHVVAASIGAIVTVDSSSTGLADTQVVIPTPNHSAGDVLVYIIARNGSNIVTAPSDVDFTVGGNINASPTDWWYMRVGTGTTNEPASRAWTFSAARVKAATCVVIQGAMYPTGLLFNQSNTYNDNPSITTPSSTSENALALAICVSSQSALPPDSRTHTLVTEVLSGGTTNSCGFDLQSSQLPVVGTPLTMGWDLAGSSNFNVSLTSVVFRSVGSNTRPSITTTTSTKVVSPGATVTLSATATDPDPGDSITSYNWACNDATADVNLIIITSPTNAVTTVTLPNYEAAFSFVCTVTDTHGTTTSDVVSVCTLKPVVSGGGSLYQKNSDGSLTQLS